MINRDNWMLTKEYLQYRVDVDQLSEGSADLERYLLRYLLEWADDVPFKNAPSIRPTYPQHVLRGVRHDGKSKPFSQNYTRMLIKCARRFFRWLMTHRRGYRTLDTYVDTLVVPRMPVEPRKHEIVTLDEIHAIATAPVGAVWERRIRAAAVFWFLSGIRVTAFATLPILAVDLSPSRLEVRQWPQLGVRTKFSKHATTYLLDIPELLDVVREWDAEVRAVVPAHGMWFAQLSPETGEIVPEARKPGKNRAIRVRTDLRKWMDGAGLPYHSPHKFRHGHAVYALKQAQDMADLKAVSQNLMHSDIKITDKIYSILSPTDVKERVTRLGNGHSQLSNGDTSALIAQIEDFLDLLKNG
jgi:site-specific recombinase XerD